MKKFVILAFWSILFIVNVMDAPKARAQSEFHGPNGFVMTLAPNWVAGSIQYKDNGSYTVEFSNSKLHESCLAIHTANSFSTYGQDEINILMEPERALKTWQEFAAHYPFKHLSLMQNDVTSDSSGTVRRSLVFTNFHGDSGAKAIFLGTFFKRPGRDDFLLCNGLASSPDIENYRHMVLSFSPAD